MSIPPPVNFQYHPDNKTLSWDEVPDAEEYEVYFKPDSPSADWNIAYNGGNDTHCSFEQPEGLYIVYGRSRDKGGWGTGGPEETVQVSSPTS